MFLEQKWVTIISQTIRLTAYSFPRPTTNPFMVCDLYVYVVRTLQKREQKTFLDL